MRRYTTNHIHRISIDYPYTNHIFVRKHLQQSGRREAERIGGAAEEGLCREGVRRPWCQVLAEAVAEGCHEGEETTWQESLMIGLRNGGLKHGKSHDFTRDFTNKKDLSSESWSWVSLKTGYTVYPRIGTGK